MKSIACAIVITAALVLTCFAPHFVDRCAMAFVAIVFIAQFAHLKDHP